MEMPWHIDCECISLILQFYYAKWRTILPEVSHERETKADRPCPNPEPDVRPCRSGQWCAFLPIRLQGMAVPPEQWLRYAERPLECCREACNETNRYLPANRRAHSRTYGRANSGSHTGTDCRSYDCSNDPAYRGTHACSHDAAHSRTDCNACSHAYFNAYHSAQTDAKARGSNGASLHRR